MTPRDLVYVGHMLDMARKAMSKTQGISRETYDADENLRFALIHLIHTVGEAARQVSREFCNNHPDIRWSDIIGMRHKVVHDYLGIDDDLVWQMATKDLPKLVTSGTSRVARHVSAHIVPFYR